VPAFAFDAVAEAYAPYALGDHIVLHAARGVGEGFVLPHQAIRHHTCARKIGALGGPLYFDDLEKRRPLFVALGARFPEVSRRVKALTDKTPVRLHPGPDLLGIEIAGAISNVSHLAAGMADGLELGQTARGVILCQGLAEATLLGTALGAEASTFAGLAGVGDLIPREVSSTARHDEVGKCMASGDSLEDAMASVEGHVEGVLTAREARAKGKALGLELPLINAVADILDGEADPALRLDEVLDLDLSLGAEAVTARRTVHPVSWR
jgi:glycerol-3-phosphate dehydrogenase (NAD(P)+)